MYVTYDEFHDAIAVNKKMFKGVSFVGVLRRYLCRINFEMVTNENGLGQVFQECAHPSCSTGYSLLQCISGCYYQ